MGSEEMICGQKGSLGTSQTENKNPELANRKHSHTGHNPREPNDHNGG